MVSYEDKAFEKFSLGRDGELALPVCLLKRKNGEISVITYRKTGNIVKRFLKKSKLDPLSEEAVTELRLMLDPTMEKYGYFFDEKSEYVLEFEATSPKLISSVETVIFKTNEEVRKHPADTTLWNLEVDDEDEADVICAVIKDGRIAAFAAINDISDDGGLELNVECAPSHRKQGFASSCAAGLANYLISEGLTSKVNYKCRKSNEASRKTALRAGFEFTGERFTFVYRRNIK